MMHIFSNLISRPLPPGFLVVTEKLRRSLVTRLYVTTLSIINQPHLGEKKQAKLDVIQSWP